MSVISKKVDFSLFRGLNGTKTWTLTALVGGNIVPYDISAKTITLRAYDRNDPVTQLYELSATAHTIGGLLTYNFLAVQTDYDGPIDYLLIEDPLGAQTTIGYGTLEFIPISQYIPFSEMVANETPNGVILSDNWITLKQYEWRLWLQNAITPNISDEDVQNETAWPVLVNILIAKLVVYDHLLKTIKGGISSTGSDASGGGGNVKQIVTGPTTVEFHDSFSSIAKLAMVDKNGNSALTGIAIDICTLARRLTIYLPICNNPYNYPIIPVKAGRLRHPMGYFPFGNVEHIE